MEDTRDLRLRQLTSEFDRARDMLITYELPFITGNSSPTLAQLERAERTLNRMIQVKAVIEELRNLK